VKAKAAYITQVLLPLLDSKGRQNAPVAKAVWSFFVSSGSSQELSSLSHIFPSRCFVRVTYGAVCLGLAGKLIETQVLACIPTLLLRQEGWDAGLR
jgi:hypothetical protein